MIDTMRRAAPIGRHRPEWGLGCRTERRAGAPPIQAIGVPESGVEEVVRNAAEVA